MPIIGYIYSPFKELPNYAPLFGMSPFQYLSLRDYGCGKACPLTTYFEKIGLTMHCSELGTLFRLYDRCAA
jgi:hypothetical protein